MVMSIEEKREQLKQLINKLDSDKVKKYYDQIVIDLIPEEDEEITEEEWKEIEEARERMNNGEFVTLEDLLKELDGEDDV